MSPEAATAEILRAIATTPDDAGRVLTTIARTAQRLFGASVTRISRIEHGVFREAAAAGSNARGRLAHFEGMPADRGSVGGRAALDKRIIHVEDMRLHIAEFPHAIMSARTYAAAPLLRKGEAIGSITVARAHVRPFTKRQLDLLQSFADQAVIAIENARLLSELRESLENQTASADILRAIASTPGEPQHALNAIAEAALRMFDASSVNIRRLDGGILRYVASLGPIANNVRAALPEGPPNATTMVGAAILEKRQIVIQDVEHPQVLKDWPGLPARSVGARAIAATPMFREGQAIGGIVVHRTVPNSFSEKDLQLLANFADQAVIAIENARLLAELRESLERQTATSDVLRMISTSPSQLDPVFDTLLENALRLCDANMGHVYRFEQGALYLAAIQGAQPDYETFLRDRGAHPVDQGTPHALAMSQRAPVQVADLRELPLYASGHRGTVAAINLGGQRTALYVPLLRGESAIGIIVLYRSEVRSFDDKQIALVENFADQAVIAIENARLLDELRESLENQTASAEILRTIASSPADVGHALDTIAQTAARMFGATSVVIRRLYDRSLRIIGSAGPAASFIKSQFPEIRIDEPAVVCQAVLENRQIHTEDIDKVTKGSALNLRAREGNIRTNVATPLTREGVAIGVMAVNRSEVRPYTEKELILLQSFADQAVIAIENARLLDELNARMRDLSESLAQQTATAEILRTIASSPGEPKRALDMIAETAVHMFGASSVGIRRVEGKVLRYIGSAGSAADDIRRMRPEIPLDRSNSMGLATLEKRQIHVADFDKDQFASQLGEIDRLSRDLNNRTYAITPLLREGEAIGVMAVNRSEVQPFTEKELQLLTSFADQAVIAIENARLLSELRESLENQTASADILRAIASAPGDAERVLQTIMATTRRLFGCSGVHIRRLEGEVLRSVGSSGATSQGLGAQLPELPVDPKSLPGAVVVEQRQIHIPDIEHPEPRMADWPGLPIIFRAGARTVVGTPLMREGRVIGVMTAQRDELRSFNEKELAQLVNFADQAVIAIENARLLSELRDSLERQTATAKVLEVISSSPGELQPVFDAMLANALRLCGAQHGWMYRYDGDAFYLSAIAGVDPEFEAMIRAEVFHPIPESVFSRILAAKEPVAVVDTAAIPAYRLGQRLTVAGVEKAGTRSALHVPMVKDDVLVGTISIFRKEVRPFDSKHIELLSNFAAQAVIAIENARLLDELREALESQTASAEILRTIASAPADAQRAIDAIAVTTARLFGASSVNIRRLEGGVLRYAASMGSAAQAVAAAMPEGPPDPTLISGASVLEKRQIVIQNVDDPQVVQAWPRLAARSGGSRVVAATPLVRENQAIGTLVVHRGELKPFTDKELAQLTNFAAQAVIAIENARLLDELNARMRDLSESLEQQTASAEILRAIASEPGEPQDALDAIAETAARMFAASSVGIRRIEGDVLRYVCAAGPSAAAMREALPEVPFDLSHVLGRSAVENRQIHVADVQHSNIADNETIRAHVDELGVKTMALTPLSSAGTVIGVMVVNRDEVRPFLARELEQMRGFADQAVIAIENARLLDELNARMRDVSESLEQQTATAEILRTIATTPAEAERALDTVCQNAARIFGASSVGIRRVEGDVLRYAGAAGPRSHRIREEFPELPLDGDDLASVAVRERRQYQVEKSNDEIADKVGPAGSIAVTPLLRRGEGIGAMIVTRDDVRPFQEKEFQLMASFADQAVIAIENARLLDELRETLDRQTATAEVLSVISASPGDLDPVFNTMLERATRLCRADVGTLALYDGEGFRGVAVYGHSQQYAKTLSDFHQAPRGTGLARMENGRQTIQVADVTADPAYEPVLQANPDFRRIRTALHVPILKQEELVGAFLLFRHEVRPFNSKELELVENFAEQAVIAMENTRLLDELRTRQAELRVTFDNMGDGVVMFDQQLRLAAWNRNLQQILDIPDSFFAQPKTYRDYVTYMIERGEFSRERAMELARLDDPFLVEERFERTRPNGQVLEVRRNPVPGGGFVLIFSDITERKRAEEEIRVARDAAERALSELKLAQASLIQAEKMASLGQLTAGIAHEIKNPLNFVNNFAGLSVELLDELKDSTAPAMAGLEADKRDEVAELIGMLTSNLEKVAEHGRRADGIVKSMLAHSRGSSGERQSVNLNALVEESLNLAYHGARAQDQNFNVTMERDLDPSLAPIEVVPQDLTRVFLNLIGNGFYAANKRRRDAADPEFRPVLKVATEDRGADVVIRIRDNGIGIPPEIRDKLFEPFFTTKPTGEGTGLGLSISYEIVTQQHGGTIEVESEPGVFTEFTVKIPKRAGSETRTVH